MRSIAEISFRAKQEIGNLSLLWFQPRPKNPVSANFGLPDSQQVISTLAGSEFSKSAIEIADGILARQFPLLGTTITIPGEIEWRKDYAHQRTSGLPYFRRLPYLNFEAVGDHKFVWELNRHQHLVLLAQAYLFTGRQEFKETIFEHLEAWFVQNPFQRGINWASALEVAFRSLSWVWVYRLIGADMPAAFRSRFLTELYRHGAHLELNLSLYFSPNTHLLGEAVALHTLGKLFAMERKGDAWQTKGARTVEAELVHQVQADGSHFEQSSYYHVYALDFFLFFYLTSGRPESFEPVLKRMAEYLDSLLGPAREIAFTGDDDGGRFFHPYGNRSRFGRATLSTCGLLFHEPRWVGSEIDLAEQAAWWVPQASQKKGRITHHRTPGPRFFADSGTAFLQAGDLYLQMDCGPFGFGGGGHSHSDSLSVLLTAGREHVLIDPGTYTYVADPERRAWFRGSSAHNTVRVDMRDQAVPQGPFRWADKPSVKLDSWTPQPSGGLIDAVCKYANISHRRRIALREAYLLVLDEIEGPEGEHTCEVVWQLGSGANEFRFLSSVELRSFESRYSPAYGCALPGRCLIGTLSGSFPISIATLLTKGKEQSISVSDALASLLQFSEKS